MPTRIVMAVLVLASLGTFAQAQEKTDDEQRQRLQFFVGAWDVTVQFRLPDGKNHEGKSALQTKAVLEGAFIQQEYKSKLGDVPLTVWQLLGYDTQKNKFVQFDLHAEGKEMHTMHNEGSFTDDGKVLTLTGDTIDAQTGKPVKLKAVTTIIDRDHYRLEWFFVDGAGKEERKVVLTHGRRK